MPRSLRILVLALVALLSASPLPPGTTAHADLDELSALAQRAVDANRSVADPAIATLRARGRAGYDALVRVHAAAITTLRDAPTFPPSAETERLRHAVDVVSGQRDAHASGLYFHTDLDAALAEARARHVPVLSFRLLGHLDEELSCANSRYFRTLVYSNPDVSRALRERFVLHVSTERPAPTITIDMGDGRTMVRTITGNSVHYVIDEQGRVLDAIPGLYAPSEFQAVLTAAERTFAACGPLTASAFDTCLVAQHTQALAAIEATWELLRTSHPDDLPTWAVLNSREAPRVAGRGAPSARNAMAETMSKMMVEAPVLDTFSRTPTPQPYEGINWPRLVGSFGPSPAAPTLALLRLKTGESDVTAVARELSRNAVADSLRNEVTMHRRIHSWFMNGTPHDFASINNRVYTEIFLTPASDPWLGLRANDVWDAIETLH